MGGRRKPPPRPLDLAWIGKYVRLWHDRGKNRFVEGVVEKSVVGCGYPVACVLRVPGSPGYTVLSEERDIEEIVPTQELLEALTKDTFQRALPLVQKMAPQTLLRIQEVNRTIDALVTDTNQEAIQALRVAVRALVETEAAEVEAWVYDQLSGKFTAVDEILKKIYGDLRRAYVGTSPDEKPKEEVSLSNDVLLHP
jgi:predicted transcriptional regulator